MNPEISSTDRFVDRLSRSTALDGLATAIQPVVRRTLEGEGDVATPVKDFLHGRWLGHALHPVLTDIPIGAWSMTLLFDVLAVTGRRDYEAGADLALGVGILGSVGAAVTGFAEWADTKDEPRRLGMAHALLNVSGLALYLASYALRKTNHRSAGRTAAFAGYGVTSLSAYLGGELAYGYGLGVKHTAVPTEPATTFTPVCDADAIPAGETRPAVLDGAPILVTRRDAGVFAVAATCTHRGAPLHDGSIDAACVRCPWHGSRFDLRDGRVLEGPATYGLARFDARVRGGSIEVRRAFAD